MINSKSVAICALVFCLLLAGCSPRQLVGATVTPTPTLTNTPAPTKPSTPSPTATETPLPTATATAKGVEWTTVENIQDCAKNPLNDKDMEPGGRVDQYLTERKPELIAETNWDIIKDDIRFRNGGGVLIYDSVEHTGVKFVNPEKDPTAPDTNPFDRDIDAFGLYTAGNGRKYCFIPLVIRDIDAPTETGHDIYFIKLLLPLQYNDGTPLSQFELDYMFENWNDRMNIAPIGLNSQPMARPNPTDDRDLTFAHLDEGSPEFERWFQSFLTIIRGRDPVHGPLSEFKKFNDLVFPTEASNLTNADGTPSNKYK